MPEPDDGDLEIGLSDAQSLSRLRYELLAAKHVLGANMQIAQGTHKHHEEIHRWYSKVDIECVPLRTRLDLLMDQMRGHEATTSTLQTHLDGVMTLV